MYASQSVKIITVQEESIGFRILGGGGGALVAKSYLTLVTLWPVACQAPLSMGFPWTKIPDGVAISFSKDSSQPRDQT